MTTAISERAQAAMDFYETQLKSLLEPDHTGKYVAIEPDAGDYALGDTTLEASQRLRARRPSGHFVTRPVGPDRRRGTITRLLLEEAERQGERK